MEKQTSYYEMYSSESGSAIFHFSVATQDKNMLNTHITTMIKEIYNNMWECVVYCGEIKLISKDNECLKTIKMDTVFDYDTYLFDLKQIPDLDNIIQLNNIKLDIIDYE